MRASIESPGQEHLFSIQLEAGHRYQLTVDEAEPSLVHFRAALLAPDGQLLEETGGGTFARFEFHSATAGDYLIRVREETGQQTGTYTLTVVDLGVDDHGNRPDQATPLQLPTSAMAGSIESLRDSDLFAFTAVAGHHYEVDCVGSQELGPCNIALVDASGEHLAYAPEPLPWRFSVMTGGRYHLRAFGDFGRLGAYALSLASLGPDDHGSLPAAATPVLPHGGKQVARLEAYGDVDVLRFEARAGWTYIVRAFEEGGAPYTSHGLDVRLLDGSGAVRATSNVGQLSVSVTTDETLFAELRWLSELGARTYEWELLELRDDHGNDRGQATAVHAPPPAPLPLTDPKPRVHVAGTIEAAGDVDVFAFHPVYLSRYRVRCKPITLSWCWAHVYHPGGGLEGALMVSPSSAESTYRNFYAHPLALWSGPFLWYIEVQTGSPGEAGSYELSVEEFAPDDHAGGTDFATPLAGLGVPASGNLEWYTHTTVERFSTERDFFSLALTAGQTYEVTLTGSPFALQVWDGGTSPLAQGVSPLRFSASRTGPTWFEVHFGDSTTTPGPYTLQVDRVP